MIKKSSEKQPLIFSVLTIILAEALLGACLFLFQPFRLYQYNFITVVSYLIPLIFVLLIIFALKLFPQLRFSARGLRKGLFLGWLFILIGLVSLITGFNFSKLNSIASKSWAMLLPFSAVMLLNAMIEEFLFRGIMLNLLLKKWNTIKKAVIVSALIFGAAHMIQLISTPSRPMGIILTIMLAFGSGVYFAAIYIRSKNIWAVVLLHAIFDWLSNVPGVLTQPAGEIADISLGNAIINIALAVLFFSMGLFLLRKKKIDIPAQ